MTRIELITSRDGLDDETAAVFDWVVESRGQMLRPFEVLLHAPALAQPVAELGHVVLSDGTYTIPARVEYRARLVEDSP